MTTQTANTNLVSMEVRQTKEGQPAFGWMIVFHLLPGALIMFLMLMVSRLLNANGMLPSVPVLFAFVAPFLILMQLGFL